MHASGAYEGRASLTGQPNASKGKLVCNAKTRQVHSRVEHAARRPTLRQCARSWYRRHRLDGAAVLFCCCPVASMSLRMTVCRCWAGKRSITVSRNSWQRVPKIGSVTTLRELWWEQSTNERTRAHRSLTVLAQRCLEEPTCASALEKYCTAPERILLQSKHTRLNQQAAQWQM